MTAGFAAPAAGPELQEIATSGDGRDITKPYLGPLEIVQDTVLQGLGQNWKAYREIRRDGQVHSTFQQRRLAIVARPLIVEPGAEDAASKAAAAQLQLNLDEIAYDRATKGMSWGFFYGFSVGECMWSIKDNKVWLDGVKVRTPWRFRFTPEGELRLLTRANAFRGEPMPDRKFWILSSGADNDDDPYGLGLAHQLFWPVYFKKQGLAFWLRALEKFGAPTAVGTYPPGTSQEDQEKLLQAVQAIRVDGAVIKPEGTVIELLEALKGTVDQANFNKVIDREISKIVVGQTMTTDEGSSLSQSRVHQNTREDVTDADVEELCESFQQGPARWLTDWNFPGAAIPKLTRPSPEDQNAAAKLATEKATAMKTMSDAGFEPEDDTLKELYPGWRRKAAPPPAAAPIAPIGADTVPAPAFAEPAELPRDAIDTFVQDLDWEPLVQPILTAVEQLVKDAPDLKTAANKLAEILTGQADQAVLENMARALLEAALAGQGGLALSDRQASADAAGG